MMMLGTGDLTLEIAWSVRSCMDVDLGSADDDLNLEFATGRLELTDDESETGDAILSDVR